MRIDDKLESDVRSLIATADPARSALPADLVTATALAPASGQGRPAGAARGLTRRRAVAAAVAMAAAAAGVAAGVAVTGSPAAPAGTAVLTAATVHRVQAASAAALAPDSHILVTYGQGAAGQAPDSTGSIDVTFAGSDFNAIEQLPAAPGGAHQMLTIRQVSGQIYLYGGPGRPPQWARLGAAPQAGRTVPDPRRILAALQPAAGFTRAGSQPVSGVPATILRATRLTGLPAGVLSALTFISSFGHQTIASLAVWVDDHDVVRQMQITYNVQGGQGPLVQTETVRFLDIGKPQTIEAPPIPGGPGTSS